MFYIFLVYGVIYLPTSTDIYIGIHLFTDSEINRHNSSFVSKEVAVFFTDHWANNTALHYNIDFAQALCIFQISDPIPLCNRKVGLLMNFSSIEL